MLRSLLLSISDAAWIRRIMTRWQLARRFASRFVAGDHLPEAMKVVGELNARGLYVSLDHLGENVTQKSEAEGAVGDYMELMDAIIRNEVAAGISVKLSQLGLKLAFDFCAQNMLELARTAAGQNVFVRIDMEDSSTVGATIEIFDLLRRAGIHNVGLVLQAYLRRTQDDVGKLLRSGCPIRLCKGAYNEPPEVAFPKKAHVDANFDRIAEVLIDHAVEHGYQMDGDPGRFPRAVAIATHDEERITFARQYALKQGLPREELEFQMLYGIRSDLQTALADEGYPVRVYVPYGTEWYPYFMRRLAERPANVWFLLSNLIRG